MGATGTQLVESDFATFRRDPVGRFVRTEHVLHYWLSRELVGWVVVGRVDRRDVDLIVRATKLGDRRTPFRSLFDAARLEYVPPAQFARWFAALLDYIRRTRRSLRDVAGILPRDLAAKATFHGVMRMAPASWRNHLVGNVAEGLTRLGVRDTGPAEREIARVTRLLASGGNAAHAPGEALTEREREIAALVARGLSDLNIAELLAIRESTVGSHLASIYRKLAVHSRVELVHRLGSL